MLITVFSPKGGSGTSTCAALIAKSFSIHMNNPTTLIDAHNGDIESVIGIDSESEYGFLQWIRSSSPSSNNLQKISNYIDAKLSFVNYSSNISDGYNNALVAEGTQFEKVKNAFTDTDVNYVIDIGTNVNTLTTSLIESSDLVIMVMKECYVSLNRASAHPYVESADVAVVVKESGRSISSKQIGEVLKLRCFIEIEARRDFAKIIDAGVLLFRTPKNMISALNDFVIDVKNFTEGAPQRSGQDISRQKKTDIYDRTQNISARSLDIFDEAKDNTSRDFWSDDEQMPVVKPKVARSIDTAYTSHLHAAFAGMKSSGKKL